MEPLRGKREQSSGPPESISSSDESDGLPDVHEVEKNFRIWKAEKALAQENKRARGGRTYESAVPVVISDDSSSGDSDSGMPIPGEVYERYKKWKEKQAPAEQAAASPGPAEESEAPVQRPPAVGGVNPPNPDDPSVGKLMANFWRLKEQRTKAEFEENRPGETYYIMDVPFDETSDDFTEIWEEFKERYPHDVKTITEEQEDRLKDAVEALADSSYFPDEKADMVNTIYRQGDKRPRRFFRLPGQHWKDRDTGNHEPTMEKLILASEESWAPWNDHFITWEEQLILTGIIEANKEELRKEPY